MRKIRRCIVALIFLSIIFNLVVSATPPCNDTKGLADTLYDFGLFKGTGIASDGSPLYSLERSSTRQEAVVMLIRLLGKEMEASQSTSKHPFTDVDSWADRYVAYAFAESIAKGISDTQFGSNQSVNAQQYLTFLLRALGYSDDKGDFTYQNVFAFSDKIGLTKGVYSLGKDFLRGDMVWLSSSVLLQKTKDGLPLIKKLKSADVVTSEQYITGLSTMMFADLKEQFRYLTIYGDDVEAQTIDAYGLYSEPGTGQYSGYERLRGYFYDSIYPIYFQGKKDSFTCATGHNHNLYDVCNWTFAGNVYQNSREECYEFFSDTTFFQSYFGSLESPFFSVSWFQKTFGDIYDDWLDYKAFGSMNTEKLVRRYLELREGIFYREPLGGLYPEMYFGLFDFIESWTEQQLESEWIDEDALRSLSDDSALSFGVMASSLPNWSLDIGKLVFGFFLEGTSSKELMLIYDIPEDFAKAEASEGEYSNIRFKIVDGKWYFNPSDLITVGLLNEDGTLNSNFEPQTYNYDLAKKAYEKEWITERELRDIYNLSSLWFGGEVWIFRDAYDAENGVKHIITGAPQSKMETGTIYSGLYKSRTIRFKYEGELQFNYQDLADADIIWR